MILGIGLAIFLWFLMFAPFTSLTHEIHQHYFWPLMSCSALILSTLAFRNLKTSVWPLLRINRTFVWIGIGHSIALYGLSRFGVYLMIALFGNPAQQAIGRIYEIRSQLSVVWIFALIALLIAPAEELVWRGWIQNRLQEKIGQKKAFFLTALIYSGIHAWSLNPPLLLAAFVLGLHWGYLFRRFQSIVPGLISHVLWDLAIFVVFPIPL